MTGCGIARLRECIGSSLLFLLFVEDNNNDEQNCDDCFWGSYLENGAMPFLSGLQTATIARCFFVPEHSSEQAFLEQSFRQH
jgi:hypothetical protein